MMPTRRRKTTTKKENDEYDDSGSGNSIGIVMGRKRTLSLYSKRDYSTVKDVFLKDRGREIYLMITYFNLIKHHGIDVVKLFPW